MTDPCGSLTMPEIFEFWVCAKQGEAIVKRIARAAVKPKQNKTRTEKRIGKSSSPGSRGSTGLSRVRDRFRLSRLRTPSVSWLGGTAPRGLPALRKDQRSR